MRESYYYPTRRTYSSILNPQSSIPIRNPQSAIRNPQSAMRLPTPWLFAVAAQLDLILGFPAVLAAVLAVAAVFSNGARARRVGAFVRVGGHGDPPRPTLRFARRRGKLNEPSGAL
jgi:hypothetical protein